jgi:hypothetical protein
LPLEQEATRKQDDRMDTLASLASSVGSGAPEEANAAPEESGAQDCSSDQVSRSSGHGSG